MADRLITEICSSVVEKAIYCSINSSIQDIKVSLGASIWNEDDALVYLRFLNAIVDRSIQDIAWSC